MTITLSYSNTTMNIDALVDGYRLREIFHNNLKQADNSLSLSAVFTLDLANFLKANINNDIKCVVAENNSNIYTGYVRKNITFQKTQINKPIQLEIVSPSYLLNKTMERGQAYVNKTLAYTVTDLVQKAGFTDIRTLTPLGYSPKLITVKKDENIKTVLTELLWEYGYTWDFDKDGYFYVSPLFDIPDTDDIEQTFDGDNCLGQIQITAKEQEADSVEASYSKVEEHTNALVYEDTTGASGSYKCQQKIEASSYYNNSHYVYLDLDSKYGEVLYVTNLRKDVTTDSSLITWDASLTDLAEESAPSLINQICFTAYNRDTRYAHNLAKIDFYADAYTSSGTSVSKKSYGEKTKKTVTLKYVCDETHADSFVKNYTEWLRWATNTITLKSKTDFSVGSFVKVTDYGIGTYYGRITQKQKTLADPAYSYTIETLSEFTPATVDTSQSSSQNVMSAIQGVRTNAFAYTDQQVSQIVMEASPRYLMRTNSAIIKKTADGAYSPAKITASAVVINGDESETAYTGTFHIYINGSATEWGLPTSGSSIEISMATLAEQFNEVNSVNIVLKSASDSVLIDEENIPVLANPNAYSILIENGYNAFTCDDTGIVSAQSVECSPHVYYGLAEIPYGSDGWEFSQLPVADGFTFSIDSNTGKITVSTVDGANIADNGSIAINLFIHSSTDETYHIGYEASGEEIWIGYTDSGASVEVGYTQPSEDGTITCYFNYSKLSELGLLLKRETDTSSQNYGETVLNGKKIKVGSIETEAIAANAITADKMDVNSLMAEELTVGNVLKSAIYSEGSSGFKLDHNGNAEFNNATVRGKIDGGLQSSNFNYRNHVGFSLGRNDVGQEASVGYLQNVQTTVLKGWRDTNGTPLTIESFIMATGSNVLNMAYRGYLANPLKVYNYPTPLDSLRDTLGAIILSMYGGRADAGEFVKFIKCRGVISLSNQETLTFNSGVEVTLPNNAQSVTHINFKEFIRTVASIGDSGNNVTYNGQSYKYDQVVIEFN